MPDPFASPSEPWTPVSSRLITVRLIGVVAAALGLCLIGGVLLVFAPWWLGLPFVIAGLGVLTLGAWMVPRQVRAIGYDVGGDALSIRTGIMFQQLVVVPYARMQYVDVQAGPLMRRYRLASVQLHTASATTDARVPGLDAGDASALRDELARLGETRSVGL